MKRSPILYLMISLFLALLLGGILFSLSGYSPLSVYREIFKGALGSPTAIVNTLAQAMPIIFTGLSFMVASKSGIVNIGGEGQMYAGAMAAAIIGVYVTSLPSFLHVLLALLGAAVVAGLWGALIAFLKVRFGSQEVITAIMLNFIMQYFTSYLVNFPLKDEGSVGQTKMIQDSAKLFLLVKKPNLSIGILIAVVLTILLYFIFKYTQTGFELTVTGKNMDAAKVAGIPVASRMVFAMFVSGAIAGLGGAMLILGLSYRFIDGFSSGYGFDGIAVAALAGGNIAMILVSGCFFGALKSGAMVVNRIAKIPFDFVMVIQALVIIFIATPKFAKWLVDSGAKGMGLIQNNLLRRHPNE